MSCLYDISLGIAYAYDTPAGASRSMLRITPGTTACQRMISGLVEVDPPPAFRRDGVDFFGNATVELAHDSRLDEVAFRFTGRVRREEAGSALDLSPPLPQLVAEIAETASIAPDSPHHFTGASTRVRPEAEIAAFAQAVIEPEMSAVRAVKAVAHALHGLFTFDSTATDVTTDPLVAFRNRRGVCQDISHVMIGALRAVSVPAGYVSGFLRTEPPEGRERLEGVDAMHAWVRAWCGHETGWVEIDPTNDILVGVDHVAVAVGRDYADVAPVRGSLRASGAHRTTHSVDVKPVREVRLDRNMT